MNNGGQMIGAAGGFANDYAAKGQYAQTEQVRRPEIPRYMEELEKNLGMCSELLNMLENKLSGFTSADPPSPGKDCAVTAAAQTGMGTQMQQFASHAATIGARLSSLNRRLEV